MNLNQSKSLELAKQFLGKEVDITIDRQVGSNHPKHNFLYEANYGYIEGVIAPDGENLDAYYLGEDKPINKATGTVIAIIHRLNDDDDKLVVVPRNINMTDEEIENAVTFQEKWFEHKIIRK